MIGARLRKVALLATLASVIACCLGSSDGFAIPTPTPRGTIDPGAPTLAGQAGARSKGPAVEAGPVTAPSLKSAGAATAPVAVPVPGGVRPPSNGSILPRTRVPGAAAAEAGEGAAAASPTRTPGAIAPVTSSLELATGKAATSGGWPPPTQIAAPRTTAWMQWEPGKPRWVKA